MRVSPAPPRGPAPTRPQTLPAPLTRLIGREAEVVAVRDALLSPEIRLLTLVGAPGIGKTRLSLAVAQALVAGPPAGAHNGIGAEPGFADGVVLVPLAPLRDPELVVPAIAQALGVRVAAGRPILDTVQAALRHRRLLLVLDNCEHLPAAAPLVSELLEACPELTILATSRAPLHVYGEHEYPVPPLALPNLARLDDPVALAGVPAVALLVERAQAVRPDFALTSQNAAAVAEVCVRLDGLPLALELAAARLKLLPPQALLARLGSRLDLLTDGARDRPERHQTLRAALAWSHDLLSAGEQRLLQRLAVFAGGCTLEAAEAVCASDDLDAAEVLDLLQYLVDRSLVIAEEREDGANRFRMLEMVQQYAMEHLVESGEAERLHRQHALCHLMLAEEAQTELRGPHEGEWSGRLEEEIDNLRAALRWSIERGEAELALRLGSALWRFWTQRGHLAEGLIWLEQALALPGTSTRSSSDEIVRARAGALNGAGNVAAARGEHARSTTFHEESLALRRWLTDTAGVATSLHNLGIAARHLGLPAVAYARFNECLGLFRDLGDTRNAALSLLNLGRLSHDAGDYERAATLYDEGLAHFQTVGSAHGMATAYNRMGDLARDRGDLATAERLHRDALALRQGRGDPWVMGLSLTGLARVAMLRRDHGQTMTLTSQSLQALHEAGASRDTATALIVMAAALCVTDQAAMAAQLLGAVARAYPDGSSIPAEQASFDRARADCAAALGESNFAAAWIEVQQLSLDGAVSLAVSLAETASAAAGALDEQPPSQLGSTLTRREREVAALVARGLTDAQLAEALVIGRRTAETHVAHCLGKLGLATRAGLAAWAVEQGLAAARPV